MSNHNNPFEEFNMLIHSIEQDKKELKESAVRCVELASKLLQVDPDDESAQESLELAKRMLTRP